MMPLARGKLWGRIWQGPDRDNTATPAANDPQGQTRLVAFQSLRAVASGPLADSIL
jgi:hypothetical protein